MSLRRLAAAALCLAAAVVLSAAEPGPNPWPWGLPDTGPRVESWPWGPFDAAAPGLDAAGPPDTGPTGPCAAPQARFDRRRAFLAARREEQFALGGAANPKMGIRNAVHIYCEAHPGDEDCALYNVTVTLRADEVLWHPDAGVDDFEPHLVVMRRALSECLQSSRRP
ncbi:MAG TPA: hypothetical protein VGK67_01690 [Myxococcales bacterium]|jgi:hypothetical protein